MRQQVNSNNSNGLKEGNNYIRDIILIQDKICIFFIEPLDFVGGLINFCGML